MNVETLPFVLGQNALKSLKKKLGSGLKFRVGWDTGTQLCVCFGLRQKEHSCVQVPLPEINMSRSVDNFELFLIEQYSHASENYYL